MDLAKITAGVSARNLATPANVRREPRIPGTPSILNLFACLYPSVSLICLSFGTIIGVIT